jgi:hypothetical protein
MRTVIGNAGPYRPAARNRALSCCSRIASVKTNKPAIESSLFSSSKPWDRRASTTTGFSFRVLPQPNSLISKRCSGRVNPSQIVEAAIVGAPFSSKNRDSLRNDRDREYIGANRFEAITMSATIDNTVARIRDRGCTGAIYRSGHGHEHC